MLIIGAKGFAKEILEVLHQNKSLSNIAFFDDINDDICGELYQTFPIIKSIEAAQIYFKTVSNKFTIGIGSPALRKKLFDKFSLLGGEFTSTISSKSNIGHFGNIIKEGCNIMTGVVLTNDILVNKGTLINLNCTIGHDCIIGEFVEISPGVQISGNCKIGAYTNIGSNATILPKITLGQNVIVAAGSVVTKNVQDNCMVAGIPAVIKKELEPLKL